MQEENPARADTTAPPGKSAGNFIGDQANQPIKLSAAAEQRVTTLQCHPNVTTTASTSDQVTGDPSGKQAQLAGEHLNTPVQLDIDYVNTSAQLEGVSFNTAVQIGKDIVKASAWLAEDHMLQFETQQGHYNRHRYTVLSEPIIHTQTAAAHTHQLHHSGDQLGVSNSAGPACRRPHQHLRKA